MCVSRKRKMNKHDVRICETENDREKKSHMDSDRASCVMCDVYELNS